MSNSKNPQSEEKKTWVAFERAVDVVVKAPPMHKARATAKDSAWIKALYERAEKAAAENPPIDLLVSQPPWQGRGLR